MMHETNEELLTAPTPAEPDVTSDPGPSPGPERESGFDPGPGWEWRFWLIFIGQGFSLVGSALTQFVLLWWIADTTGTVSALATAGLVALLPQALLGPFGGMFADRHSRRAIMIVADAISAACMSVLIYLFLTESIQLWHVYGMMFIRSSMQAFQAPAASASTAMLVPEHFLPRAAGLNQSMIGIMTVAAAPLGALALGIMPMGWALSIDVATALLGIVPLLFFAIPQKRVPRHERAGAWNEFKEGVHTVWGAPVLRQLYTLLTLMVLILMPSFTLVPLLVKVHFGGGVQQVALIEGLGGAGMIVGGMVIAALAPRRHALWVIWGFGLSCFTMAFAAITPGHLFPLAVAWWTLSGLAFTLGNAPLMTIIQTTIPNQLQGRVLSLLSTLTALAAPVGLALATPVGDWLGVRWLFALVGLLGGAVCLLGLLSPALREA